ncbi:hypothetical protein CGQ24_16410 [Arthrobacter sp. 7749]|nr:hypothetical protein CGQ24_16410 [Arthrobacter sp. 7749]
MQDRVTHPPRATATKARPTPFGTLEKLRETERQDPRIVGDPGALGSVWLYSVVSGVLVNEVHGPLLAGRGQGEQFEGRLGARNAGGVPDLVARWDRRSR